ncbi:Pantothenate kinase type III, CoaX-like protein [Lachnospiraceae bacterium TWA4]|nr:Pantothenate kinase type III, CoaX-like protein [Lachnospiraceae bacterium TWA4]
MILAIDIGNSITTLGCTQDSKVLFSEQLSTDYKKTSLEYAISIKAVLEIHNLTPSSIRGVIVGSVVPPVTDIVKEAIKKIIPRKKILVVGAGVKTGLNILIDNPAQIGSDLIAGAVAGISLYTPPLILIDFGTAMTICVIDKNKNYIGGMILPGIKVSLDSLTSKTSKLPRISLSPPKHLIGRSTIECMSSGVLYGNASCIDGMIERIREERKEEFTVIATGELSDKIIPLCRNEILMDADLILKGLALIYKKNS